MFTTNLSDSGRPAAAFDFASINLEAIARETSFIKYDTPGFSAEGFLLALLKAVCDGRGSLRELCNSMGNREDKALSREGLNYRFSPEGLIFLERILGEIIAAISHDTHGTASGSFERILIEDATQIRLHPGNAKWFKGVRNQAGWTSTVKFDAITDLLSGELLPTLMTDGKNQDKVNGQRIFDVLKPNDLVLRDLGYWGVNALDKISEAGAWWISRLHGLCKVWTPGGKTLEECLANSDKDLVELDVEITEQRFKARLVAVRASEEVAGQRRAKAKAHRKKMGSTPSKQALLREGWTIMVTNLSSQQMSAREVVDTYWLRWAVEIRFRALKGSSNLRNLLSRRRNEAGLRILLTAALIYAHLSAKAFVWHKRNQGNGVYLSIEKVSSWVASMILATKFIGDCYYYDIRQLVHETRIRKSQEEILESMNF